MSEKKPLPRLVFGSASGQAGKTTITCGISILLKRRGINVQVFKKGPDYIDPTWLKAASGNPCRNLDLYLMGKKRLIRQFVTYAGRADLALVEGNMGLYDSVSDDGSGSTAHIARILKAPLIFVVNTHKMARSVAALIEGYRNFEPETMFCGVILNRVAGERHTQKLIKAIEKYCGLPVVGVIPKEESLLIGERHLGLIPFPERERNLLILEKIASFLEPHLDIEGIIEIAKKAPPMSVPSLKDERKHPKRNVVRIGVFYDSVFHFYYPENLESLTSEGAELVFINSILDKRLPDVDGIYIGGGFPELYLRELSSNRTLMEDVANFVEEGKPLYAECGGLMYLCDHVSYKGLRVKMAGIIPADVFLRKRPEGHGYVEAEVVEENPFYPKGLIIRGHEFHHSALKLKSTVKFVLRMRRGRGGYGLSDGILYKNAFASYTHVHGIGLPVWAKNFVNLCGKLKERGSSSYILEEAKSS
ncbi:MAG: hydrogenobyrinic acid a,c-diamide synthase (glutamine-hydrolyzing) [Desulfobacterota bacterium]|nr:hydrogenobyrinic acid a,c-diamide synthase (glutamine-hydrolyzing) [Thermodesulfobacteriota bacterium]MDW8002540.1 cobyrinate a,c-diamide synthase [Deltaproteobacteria bacterium]